MKDGPTVTLQLECPAYLAYHVINCWNVITDMVEEECSVSVQDAVYSALFLVDQLADQIDEKGWTRIIGRQVTPRMERQWTRVVEAMRRKAAIAQARGPGESAGGC